MKRLRWTMRVVAITAALAALSAGVALGQKGGKGHGGGGSETPPAGTVYFLHDDAIWQMNADGTGRTPLPNAPFIDWFADPSQLRHNGQRWFANRWQNEVWASSENGALVPLVVEADVDVISPPVWVAGDSGVTFIGQRWELDDSGEPTVVVEAGLYAVAVAFDASGAIAGSVPGSRTLIADLSSELRIDSSGFPDHGAEVAGHSWAPDLSAFTFGIRTYDAGSRVQEIWVVDMSQVTNPYAVPPGATLLLDSGNGIGWPEWSPDGSRIAYMSWIGTYVYHVANGSRKRLGRKLDDAWGPAEWSPDSSHLVLYHWDNFSGYDAIYRFTADLGDKTELTAGLCPPDSHFDCVLFPLGWRE
jgi:hypothetical protein